MASLAQITQKADGYAAGEVLPHHATRPARPLADDEYGPASGWWIIPSAILGGLVWILIIRAIWSVLT